MMGELILEFDQLLLGGERAFEEEPGGFLEAALAGQGLDGDPAILEPGALPSMKLIADSATGTSARPGRISI